MSSRRIYVGLVIAIVTLTILNAHFSTISSQEYDEPWWNSSWHYRIKISINTSEHDRTDWPVEMPFNFTQLLEQNNITGTFDENSTRVFEINDSGDVVYEMISQFDKAIDYDGQTNAIGEVIFLLNGTVSKGTTKYFYIYYDIEENIKKEHPNYQNDGLSVTWDEEELVVNTTKFVYYIDTDRGENTSGIYWMQYLDAISETYQEVFSTSGGAERTHEFIELTNGSDNFTYDLRQNGTVIEGPVRITFRQEGDEVYWNNQDIKTGQTRLLKEYKFYYNQNHSWIFTNISNIDSAVVYRNSTDSSAVTFDTKSAFGGYNSYLESDEPSWVRGTKLAGGFPGVGFLNYNQTGTDNFNASDSDSGFDTSPIIIKSDSGK